MQIKNTKLPAASATLVPKIGLILALMTLGGPVAAEEIRIADYASKGGPGTISEFEIRDSTDRTIGTIRETIAESDTSNTGRILGESIFRPSEGEEYTATYSYGNEFDSAGKLRPTTFEADTTFEGAVIASVIVGFDEADASFSTLQPGEAQTLSVPFTEREDGPDRDSVTRTGIQQVVWRMEALEEVTVPAGTFTAARIQVNTTLTYDDAPNSPRSVTETTWRAEGVGVVRKEFESSAIDAPAVHVLTEYREAHGEDFAARDVGPVGMEGSSEWLDDGRTILVRGSGSDIWNAEDGFHFLHTTAADDGEIVVRFLSQDNTHNWAKAGLMIRESLDSDSRHATLSINPRNGASFIWRSETGGDSDAASESKLDVPLWLRLKRSGNEITGFHSNDGTTWQEIGSVSLDLPQNVYVGLAVSSHDNQQLMEARFEDLMLVGDGWRDGGEGEKAEPAPTGPVLTARDIGSVGEAGSSRYDAASDTVTLEGSGAGTLGRRDGFHFLHRRLEGEGFIMAQLTGIDGVDDLSRAGIMIRESLEPGSKHALITGTADRSLSHQWRGETSGFSYDRSRWGTPSPIWLGLYRQNDRIYAYYSRNGSKWTLFNEIELALPDEVYIGLAVTSGDNSQTIGATFTSVSFSGEPMGYYAIVEGESSSDAAPSGFVTAADDSIPNVFFASAGGSLDPVESNSFSLFLNRDGSSVDSLALEYRLSGAGAELLDRSNTPNPIEISSDAETGTLTFSIAENAFIPQDTDLTVELLEAESYDLGSNSSVTFSILARPADSWSASQFTAAELSDPTVSGDSAAPAGDGVPNLLKYALGLDARTQTGPDNLPALKFDGQKATFEFERPVDRTDIRYIVEISSDLKNWVSGGNHIALETQSLGENERVIARDNSPEGTERQRFFRLRVERR